MDFHLDPATFRERGAHGAQGKLQRVAIAAEMSKNYTFDFSRQQFLDYTRRRCVRQVAVPRLNSLFYRPRPMWIVLQKLFVVIRFDHQGLYFTQSFDHHLRCITEIGNEAEAARTSVKGEPQRINRVMRHRECLHRDVADGELGTGGKDSPVTMSREQSVASNRLRRQRVAINRHVKFSAENFKSANVIAVFVREKDAIQLVGRDAALCQTQYQLPRAQPAIDKNLAMIRRDQRAVSRAPAAKHGQAEHGTYVSRVASACANGNE